MKLASLATVLALSGSVALVVACSETADDAAFADSFATEAPQVSSEDLVISQVYGGGGNANAPFSHDFVELFNRGTKPVSLEGKALQYATSVAAFKAKSNIIALPKVTLEPGHYFLVQLAGGGEGEPLPKPDFAPAGAFGLSQEKGKVAIVRADAPLDECGTKAKPCAATDWIDLVGFGSASQAERSPAKATDKDKAAVRSGQGCVDTNDNAKDFVLAPPAPRNGATPPVVCEVADGGAAEDAGPAEDGGHAADDGGAGDVGNVNEDAGAPEEDASVLPDPPEPPTGGDEDEADAGTGGSKEPTGPSGGKGDKDDDDDDDDEPSSPGSSRPGSGGGKKGGGASSDQTPAAPATSTTETSSDCSMTPGGTRGSGGVLSIGGVLLALTALGRRRR